MRYVKVGNLIPGMTLGDGLRNVGGKAYVQVGAKLSQSYIERLKQEGYDGVIIEDSVSAEVKVEDRYEPYLYSMGSDSLMAANLAELAKIATEIVDDVVRRHSKRISIYGIQPFEDYLFCHSINTTIYSTLIGLELGLDRQGLYLLAHAAMLHDLGMTFLPKDLLKKEGSLTEEERNQVERHAMQGATYLKERGVSLLVIKGILAHHENENGTGYPNALTGDTIPDFAKIIHVADVLDAMTTRRPYREAHAVADVLEYLSSGSGILFHPAVVQAVLKKVDAYPIGSEIVLSDGVRGIVCGRTEDNFRPLVLIPETQKKVDLTENPELAKDLNNHESDKGAQTRGEDDKKATIVIVDDTYVFRRTVEVSLNTRYNVVSFDNAKEAITYITRHEVDLVLMDIEMPEMDGVTAVQHLRNDGFADLPVIFLTSVNDKNVVIKCLSVGAVDYVLKPVKQIYVQERVAEALKKHH